MATATAKGQKWLKLVRDGYAMRLDDPNDKNTYPEYRRFRKGAVFQAVSENEERRLLRLGAVIPASDEEAKAAQDDSKQEEEDIQAAIKRHEAELERLRQLEHERTMAPGMAQFQPKLADALDEIRSKEQAAAEKATAEEKEKATAKKSAQPAPQQSQSAQSAQSQQQGQQSK